MSEAAGYRIRFLVAVVLPAAVLMALEMVSSRLLAPAFGNSVYVWGSIIGVFLAAMSAGYVLGGRLADRRPDLSVLGGLLLLSSLLQWGTAIGGRWAVAAIGEATGGRPAGTLLATALLFGPATVLLATVSPFAVRLAGKETGRLGGVAGNLFALSTAGSLAGTLSATFFLIPAFGLDTILSLLVTATALAAAATFGRPGPALAAAVLAAASWISPAPRPNWQTVRVERATPYQTLVVRESDGLRTLYSDGTRHGAIDLATGEPALSYVPSSETMRLFGERAPRRLLLLGLGSGGIGRYLRSRTPGLEVTYVDIDPAVPEIAREHFGLEPQPGERIVVDDARRFVDGSAERWDWIYCDTYVGQAVPFHLATREFFALAARRLEPGGVLAVNLAGSIRHPFARAIYRTLDQVFERVEVFSIPASGNFLLVAHDSGPIPASELARRAAALDGPVAVAAEGRLGRLAARRLAVDLDLVDVPILTDRFAPVDALLNFADHEATFEDFPTVDPAMP